MAARSRARGGEREDRRWLRQPDAVRGGVDQSARTQRDRQAPLSAAARVPQEEDPKQPSLDARGEPDGGEFTPSYRAFFPEYYLTAIQTEHLGRDLSPIKTDVEGVKHGRDTAPRSSPPPPMWITELNLDISGGDPTQPNAPKPMPGGASGLQAACVQAKGVLRALSAYTNKGVAAIDFYAARFPGFALVPPAFYQAAAQQGGYPGFGQAGTTLTAVRRFLREFRGPPEVDERKLDLLGIGEDHGHFQFAGDGSAAHPPLFNREAFAFLPFQVTDERFVIPFYVMTRDLGTSLPPERYRLDIRGVDSQTAKASAADPLTRRASPARIVGRRDDRVVVEVEATDSPRLLRLED